jgi:hypothetical protein
VFHSSRFSLVGDVWEGEWVADFWSCWRGGVSLKGGFTSAHTHVAPCVSGDEAEDVWAVATSKAANTNWVQYEISSFLSKFRRLRLPETIVLFWLRFTLASQEFPASRNVFRNLKTEVKNTLTLPCVQCRHECYCNPKGNKWRPRSRIRYRYCNLHITNFRTSKIVEEWRLLGCYDVWLLKEQTFRRNLVPSSSKWQESVN